ncbi:MAG: peroxiredoxin [Leptospirales bacterium]
MPDSLKVGDKAPDFTAEAVGYSHSPVRLSELKGKWVVLYFYPKDDTPGCTVEACDFRDRMSELTDAGALVLGVSRDSVDSHRKFQDKYGLTFPLLSDPDGKLSDSYGVLKEKNMYGKKSIGIERTTFLIDGSGVVRKIYPKVKVEGHVERIVSDLSQAG